MFGRLVFESFRRQKRRKLLAGAAIALGVAVATAMIAVATNIGDKINHELRSYGANLLITPQADTLDVQIGGVDLKPPADGAFLKEADLPRIKGTFWKNNIVGFAPMLPVRAEVAAGGQTRQVELLGTYFARQMEYEHESFVTGVRTTNPWWKVTGAWPKDDSEDVLLGEALAKKLGVRPGGQIALNGQNHHIAGILSAGAAEDNEVVAPLHVAQQILGRPGAVRRVLVSALTKPEDALALRDPKSMSPAMLERWSCSPYPQSIAYVLQQALPHSRVEPIRQVANTEGTVLTRIKGLMLLITLAALLASALAVSAAMATAMFERRGEIGLMKALGAGNAAVASIFLTEAALLALLGGIVGFFCGSFLAREIGHSIFDSQITVEPVLFPVLLGIATLVTFAGSAAAIRRAVRFDPVYALKADA
ncbi:MAG TPA: FtsX-like permease family protein [Terriglobales bacterium]|nr:FtsX-like permease family protein [Terriglobales bacterium]